MSSYNCAICNEYRLGSPLTAGNDALCQKCAYRNVRALVIRACLYSFEYPAKWGEIELRIEDFASVLQPSLMEEYSKKNEEAQTRHKLRMYCGHAKIDSSSCGHFLGNRHNVHADIDCSKCGLQSCKHGFPRVAGTAHDCNTHQATSPAAHLDPATRGTEWQSCPHPHCGRPVELSAACNHMTCPMTACQTHFCFLCGLRVKRSDGVGHWSIGGTCRQYLEAHGDTTGLTEWSDARERYGEEVRRLAEEQAVRDQILAERTAMNEADQRGEKHVGATGHEVHQPSTDSAPFVNATGIVAQIRSDPVRAQRAAAATAAIAKGKAAEEDIEEQGVAYAELTAMLNLQDFLY